VTAVTADETAVYWVATGKDESSIYALPAPEKP